MFKKTKTENQLDLFSSSESYLRGKSRNYYNDNNAWHNVFRNQVYNRIDEDIFSVLYSGKMGAPNSSIRVMISMMIIKEGMGWSDEQLFEQCHFNLLVRSALGLFNMDAAVPTEATYYAFRKKVVEYERANNENLIEKAFASVTGSQAVAFQVSGKSIRMDSKLIGSNIAWYSRYELVHESLRLLWKEQGNVLKKGMNPESIEILDSMLAEEGNKVVYRNSKNEVKIKLQELGGLIFKLLQNSALQQSDAQKTLSAVFDQQFNPEDKLVIVRPKEEIKSDSIQSPHDTDAHYRNKDGNQVKGYNCNITESCNDEDLNLISYVDVNPVSVSDCHLLQTGIEKTEEVLQGKVENVSTDGAYHSPENQEFCKENGTKFILPTIQGAKGRFDLILSENDELSATDTFTGLTYNAVSVRCRKVGVKKWRITVEEKYYYFSTKEIETCRLRKELEQIPTEMLNIRNNVEATIFQLGFHYPNNKTRYRGLSRNKIWANLRCLWVNFVRIQNYLGQICQKTCFLLKSALNFVFESLFLSFYILFINFYYSKLQPSSKIIFFA